MSEIEMQVKIQISEWRQNSGLVSYLTLGTNLMKAGRRLDVGLSVAASTCLSTSETTYTQARKRVQLT